jgi:hypothetical protein
MLKATVMNHPLWARRKRARQLVLACLIAALKASGFHTTGEPADPSYLSVAEVQVYARSR